MKKLFMLFSLVVLLTIPVSLVFSGTDRIIDDRNEYGGVTEENMYSPGDKEYSNGIVRIVEFYDINKKIIKIESYYMEHHARIDGVLKREQYYTTGSLRSGKLKEAEFYYTKEYSNREGIAKSKQYYDANERKIKTEFHYTSVYTQKKNISRLDVIYDSGGTAYRHIYYGKDGRVISTEERKGGEWKQVGS